MNAYTIIGSLVLGFAGYKLGKSKTGSLVLAAGGAAAGWWVGASVKAGHPLLPQG